MVIRPSGLATIVACPASLQLQARAPTLPMTDDVAEGHAGHWIANRHAAGFAREFPLGVMFNHSGRAWTVTQDMVRGAQMFVDAMGGPHNELRLEDPVACPEIHPNCQGTPDAWRFFPNYTFPPDAQLAGAPSHPVRLIRLGDYKFGHRYVEVYGNYQCISYVTGVMHRLQLTDNDPYLWVEIIIVQPRNYDRTGHVRVWRVQADRLRAFINIARAAAMDALSAEPVARTSEHCGDCEARLFCSVNQRANMAWVEFSGTAHVVSIPPESVGQELALLETAIERLKGRRDAAAVHAESLLRSGKSVAHYHMEAGGSDLSYLPNVTVDEIIGLGTVINIDLRKRATLKNSVVTPTQAIALGVDEKTMSAYAHRPPAAMKLTRDNPATIGKVFNK